MVKNIDSETTLTSGMSCSPSCSSYCQMDREVPSRKTDNNLCKRPDSHSVCRHNLRRANNSLSMEHLPLLKISIESISKERGCKQKDRRPRANFQMLRLPLLSILSSVLVFFALVMSRVAADCGCGSRCENYAEDVQCTRCCTTTVRRSISPDSYPSMNNVNEELRKNSISGIMEKGDIERDINGNNSGRKTLFPVRPMRTVNAERNSDSDSGQHQPELLRRLFDVKSDQRRDEDVKKDQSPASSSSLSLFPVASSPMMMATFYRHHHPLSAESGHNSGMAENLVASPERVARIVEQLQRRDQINDYLKTHKQLRIRKHLYNSIYRYLQIQNEGTKSMK